MASPDMFGARLGGCAALSSLTASLRRGEDTHIEGELLLEDSVKVFQRVLGVDHVWTQTAIKGVGDALPDVVTSQGDE